jgi:hypothetical protein
LETFDDFWPLPGLPIASLRLARGEDPPFHFRAGKKEEASLFLPVLRGASEP